MNRNALAGIMGVLLAISIGGNAWLYMKNSKSQKTTKDVADVALLKDSLQKQITILDSMQNLLSSTQTDYQKMADKVDELEGGGAAGNQAQIAELQNKVAYYQNLVAQSGNAIQSASSGGRVSKQDASKIAALKADLEAKLKEIESLNAQIATLTSERNNAIAERDVAIDRKSGLENENTGLKEKISRGALPQYGSLMSIGVAKKGSETVESYKAKGLEKFKITFEVMENPLVNPSEPVKEEVTIRIIGPDGEVFSTENKSMEDKSKVYSLKQTVTADGNQQKVKCMYPPSGTIGVKLKKGRYTTELWSRGVMRQKNIFDLI